MGHTGILNGAERGIPNGAHGDPARGRHEYMTEVCE